MLSRQDAKVARLQLDRRFQEISATALAARPHRGWVRAIRDALGMNAAQLGTRLGISQAAVSKLEAAERDGSIKLATLRRVADALDCELVYVIKPRESLEAILDERARTVAVARVRRVDQTMRLEAQELGAAELERRIDDAASLLKEHGNIWAPIKQ